MPSPTYTLIASNTLSSSAASVTFSSIPSTYTDLEIRWSVRSTNASDFENIIIEFNSDTGSNYSRTSLTGSGSAASSNRATSAATWNQAITNGATSTSNTFGSGALYIPSYTSTANKVGSNFGVQETNATAANIRVNAYLYQTSSAISSMKFSSANSENFVSGSSFFLYGIKNS